MGRTFVKSFLSISAAILCISFSLPSFANDCGDDLNPDKAPKKSKKAQPQNIDYVKALEEHLKNQLPGQDETVAALLHQFEKLVLGLHQGGPVGKFLVAGGPGADKGMVAEALAGFFTGDPSNMIHIDSRAPHLASLTKLTDPESQKKVQVILVDHVDQASETLWGALQQILHQGVLKLEKGQAIPFHNTFVIMTTDVGEASIEMVLERKEIGFLSKSPTERATDPQILKEATAAAKAEIKATFPLSILKSFDKVLILKPMTEEQVQAMVAAELKLLQARLAANPQTEVGVVAGGEIQKELTKKAKNKDEPEALHKEVERLEISIVRMTKQGVIKTGSIVEIDGRIDNPTVKVSKEGLDSKTIIDLLK